MGTRPAVLRKICEECLPALESEQDHTQLSVDEGGKWRISHETQFMTVGTCTDHCSRLTTRNKKRRRLRRRRRRFTSLHEKQMH